MSLLHIHLHEAVQIVRRKKERKKKKLALQTNVSAQALEGFSSSDDTPFRIVGHNSYELEKL